MDDRTEIKHRLSAEERRQSIVDAAVTLFSSKGFRGTTTRELAAAVGVTEPILYEHFQTKRELYTAIIDAKVQQARERFKLALKRYGDGRDDRAFFLALAGVILDSFRDDPAFPRLLLFSGLEGHELSHDFHMRVRERLRDFIRDYICTRVASGAIRPIDPDIAAHTFLCIFAHHGLVQIVFQYHPGKPKHAVIEEMVDIFMRGICGDQKK